MRILCALAADRRADPGTTLHDSWTMDGPRQAIADVRDLTAQMKDLGELLLDDQEATGNLRAALQQVGATYRAVDNAFERFVRAGSSPAGLDSSTFAELGRRGLLTATIRNGLGHYAASEPCTGGGRRAGRHRIPGVHPAAGRYRRRVRPAGHRRWEPVRGDGPHR